MTIGFWQVLLVGLVLALLFGSRHIPALAADAARGLKAARRQLTGRLQADEPFDDPADANRKR